MKKQIPLLGSLILVLAFMVSVVTPAHAVHPEDQKMSTESFKKVSEKEVTKKPLPQKQGGPALIIKEEGFTEIMKAKLVSVSGSTLSVTIFGIPLSISTSASTRFLGVTDASKMAVGHLLDIRGKTDSSTGIITATDVHDISQKDQSIASLEQQIQALMEQLKKLKGIQ